MATKITTKKQEEEHDLGDLLVVQLRGLYDVETKLLKAMPRIIKKGTSAALKDVFEQYRAQTEHHAKRLEEAFGIMEVRAQKMPSAAIRGLVEDVDWVTKNIIGGAAIDAGLVAGFRAIQHYKIALYGAAIEWAKLLELSAVFAILEETIHDAGEGLEALEDLAGSEINEAALGDDVASSNEEDSDDEDEADDGEENKEEDED